MSEADIAFLLGFAIGALSAVAVMRLRSRSPRTMGQSFAEHLKDNALDDDGEMSGAPEGAPPPGFGKIDDAMRRLLNRKIGRRFDVVSRPTTKGGRQKL